MEPLISIIVAIYNVEEYLDKCIKSIVNQKYKNLEIILVDDGSMDKSSEICDEWEKIDKRIKVIHKVNGGLSDARNKGLDIARGEYIGFIDGDDWIHDNLYVNLYNLIIKYNVDISICNFQIAYTENQLLDNGTELVSEVKYNNIQALEKIYSNDDGQMIVAWNKLYKRYLFDNMRYPVGKIHEDQFLTPKIFLKSMGVVYTSKKLIYYRQRQGSIMNTEFNIKRLDYLEALENRISLFSEHKYSYLCIMTTSVLIQNIICFYYKTKCSNIKNKDDICNKLKVRLNEILKSQKEYLSITDKFRIFIFNNFPNSFEKIKKLKVILLDN